MTDWLSTDEAAARLGVKRETVRTGTAFETVADLLWNDTGEWPSPSSTVVDPGGIGPLDRLRIAVARASAADALRYDLAP